MFEMKRIIIRADGNAEIGAGHLMRCLTIAGQVTKKENVLFVCADEASAQLVIERGFSAFVLGTDYKDMPSEMPVWERMKQLNVGGLQCGEVSILVDSYFVQEDYLEALRCYGRVFLMEDMGNIPGPVDGIINYNAYAENSMYEKACMEADAELYFGSCYTPVRPEFTGREYLVGRDVKTVLLTTGGGDKDNIAGRILKAVYRPGIAYKVVTGRFNPHYEELCTYAERYPGVEILHDVRDMATLMINCDMAITAGGTTVYELCSIGVPFICFSYAENQEKAVDYMGENRIALSAGRYHINAERCLEDMKEAFERLFVDENLRRELSDCEREIVDGRGAERIAAILEK